MGNETFYWDGLRRVGDILMQPDCQETSQHKVFFGQFCIKLIFYINEINFFKSKNFKKNIVNKQCSHNVYESNILSCSNKHFILIHLYDR